MKLFHAIKMGQYTVYFPSSLPDHLVAFAPMSKVYLEKKEKGPVYSKTYPEVSISFSKSNLVKNS